MNTRHRFSLSVVAAVLCTLALTLTSTQTNAATTPDTYVSGKISGVTSGRILAMMPSGWTSYASISRIGLTSTGQFKVKLPKPKTTSTSLKVSLHVVKADGSYLGSISIGKNSKTRKTTYSWYSTVAFPRGKTTTLPSSIAFNSTSKFGTLKLSYTSKLALSSPLIGVTASTGKPKGAGRLGLATSRASTSSIARVHTSALGDNDPGEDWDGDGIPNSLDIDDDGDGFPDPVDKSSGGNSSSSSTQTALYDVIGTLGSGLDDNANRTLSPINYNFLTDKFPDSADLLKELSLLDDANFTLMVRAVAPFFGTGSQRIKAAWVECTGLAWCLSTDNNDPDNFVTPPQLFSWGDGRIGDIWKHAYTRKAPSACNLFEPATLSPSYPDACKPVTWSSFTHKGYLQAAKTNGQTDITQDMIDWVATQPFGTGFGLYDPWIFSAGTGPNSRGFDLFANVAPRGYSKFAQNLQVGDVIYINAILDDGTTSKIAMTIAPFFITAPTVFSFQAETELTETSNKLKYEQGVTGCNNMYDEGCLYGSNRRPVMVSSFNPTLTLKFWRPQRQRIPETDGSIGAPFLDMGGLNYRLSVQGGDGSGFYACPNSSVVFTDTTEFGFEPVSKGTNNNEREYMRDKSPDADPSDNRYITVSVELDECQLETPVSPAPTATYLNVNDTSTSFTLRLQADSEPKFGGNRSSALQTFNFKFFAN